jgi:hypothetical protein
MPIDPSKLRIHGETARLIIANAHQVLRYKYRGTPLWALVKDLTGHGSGYSQEICLSADYDPDQMCGVAHLKDVDKQSKIQFPDTNKPGHNKMHNTAALDRMIARKNEQLEQSASAEAGRLIDTITALQAANKRNNETIEDCRKQLKELQVQQVDRASILGE